MAVVAHIHERLGWSLEPGAVAAMEHWREVQAAHRQTEKRHKYDIADYGLTREAIDRAFGRYLEFLSESGMRESLL